MKITGVVSFVSPECTEERPRLIHSTEALERAMVYVVGALFRGQTGENDDDVAMVDLFWELHALQKRPAFVKTIIPIDLAPALDRATEVGLQTNK